MKKRYWVMLAGAYAAAIIGYFIYEYAEIRRSGVEVVPALYTAATSTVSTSVSATTTAARSTAVTSVTTAVTSTAVSTSATTTVTTPTTLRTTTTTTTTSTTTATTSTTTESTTTATTIAYPLNLNTASYEQLCTLPGIGEALAQAIIEKRTRLGGYTNRNQLLEIPGIGESRYEDIRSLLYLEDEQPLTDPVVTSVPFVTPAPVTPPAETAPLVINLNTASKDDLLRLPGCTDEAADNILWLREELHGFHNPDELMCLIDAGEHTLPGINSLYVQWKPFLFVDDNGSKQLP